MKIYDLSQPLNEQFPFWPYYPPFEVKYIKRKAEHGVNAQYIMSSNHMGTHLDAPRHFVTNGRTIDEIPIEWLCGSGVIVNLSSRAGIRGSGTGIPHYVASKFGIRGLTQQFALEFAEHGIRVLAVAPTRISTHGVEAAMARRREGPPAGPDRNVEVPLGRAGTPDDVARVVLFCASDLSLFMTGSTLLVDAGEFAR